MDKERKLVGQILILLQPHPEGLEMKQLYELYLQKYQRPIELEKIEKGLTGPKFFGNHTDLFIVWFDYETNSHRVSLRIAFKERAATVKGSPAPSQFSPTGAIPRTICPRNKTISSAEIKVEDPIIAMQPVVVNQADPAPSKWIATDFRLAMPELSKNIQTITLEAEEQEEPENPTEANVKPVVSVTRLVRFVFLLIIIPHILF